MYRCQGVGSGSRPERMTLPRQSSESSALWLSKVIFSILPTQCECLWQWIKSFHICALIRVSNKQSAAAGDGLWVAVEAVSSVGTLPARMITRRPKLLGVLARTSSISAANFYTRESSIFFSLSLSLRHRHTQTPPLSLYSLLFKLMLKFPSTSWTPHPFFNPCTLLPLHIWLEQNFEQAIKT